MPNRETVDLISFFVCGPPILVWLPIAIWIYCFFNPDKPKPPLTEEQQRRQDERREFQDSIHQRDAEERTHEAAAKKAAERQANSKSGCWF